MHIHKDYVAFNHKCECGRHIELHLHGHIDLHYEKSIDGVNTWIEDAQPQEDRND